jgi:hypothetical protein
MNVDEMLVDDHDIPFDETKRLINKFQMNLNHLNLLDILF